MATKKSESILRTSIIKALKKEYGDDIFIQLNHTGSLFDMIGIPDLCGSYKGYAWWIEIKVGKAKPTVEQKARLRAIRRSGAKGYVCNSIESSIKVIELIREEYQL